MGTNQSIHGHTHTNFQHPTTNAHRHKLNIEKVATRSMLEALYMNLQYSNTDNLQPSFIQAILDTDLSQMIGVSMHVGLLMTVFLNTETLLPPPSRFCNDKNNSYSEYTHSWTHNGLPSTKLDQHFTEFKKVQSCRYIFLAINLQTQKP
jgi:hypothetical protein